MSINLLDNNYLLENGYIMQTKKGTAWRCGKGYRKDWTKLIGKEVLLHNKPYILTNRVKKNNKWYLVFTDGQNNYTELQTKALHNKNLAKDTIIEAATRVIAGLLPAPKELIDILVEQVDTFYKLHNYEVYQNPANYTKKGTLRKDVEKGLGIYSKKHKEYNMKNKNVFRRTLKQRVQNSRRISFKSKLHYIYDAVIDDVLDKKVFKQLIQYYHPDRYTGIKTEDFEWLVRFNTSAKRHKCA